MTGQPGSTPNDFALVPDEVADAGRYVQQVAESLVNGLNSIDADITALLSNWRGTSADSFSAGWTETKQGACSHHSRFYRVDEYYTDSAAGAH